MSWTRRNRRLRWDVELVNVWNPIAYRTGCGSIVRRVFTRGLSRLSTCPCGAASLSSCWIGLARANSRTTPRRSRGGRSFVVKVLRFFVVVLFPGDMRRLESIQCNSFRATTGQAHIVPCRKSRYYTVRAFIWGRQGRLYAATTNENVSSRREFAGNERLRGTMV